MTFHTLEDMLRSFVIDCKGSWDDYLPLIEFAYNNNFHSTTHIAPYEKLYRRIYMSLIGLFEVGERNLIGLDLVHKAVEKI